MARTPNHKKFKEVATQIQTSPAPKDMQANVERKHGLTFLASAHPEMAIFHNLCVRLKF
jgi:hypothetical protein